MDEPVVGYITTLKEIENPLTCIASLTSELVSWMKSKSAPVIEQKTGAS